MEYLTKYGHLGWTDNLLAKVKVLDTASGLCFESEIRPEEITTDTCCGFPKTTISFSPVDAPNLEDWNAEWNDRYAKLRGLREKKNITVNKIIFSGPCTIVLWDDDTKTIAKVSDGDEFDPEKGVAICFMKKIMGHTETNKLLRKAFNQYWDEQKSMKG